MAMRTIEDPGLGEPRSVNDSVFKERMQEIKTNLAGGYDEENNKQILTATLEMINELIPIAEANYRRFKIDKAAASLHMLLNQQRETINDLRALQSFSDRSEKIKDIIREAMKLCLQNLLDSATRLDENLIVKLEITDDVVKRELVKTLLQDHLQAHGQFFVEAVRDLEEQIDGYIVKTPHIPKPRKMLK